jgi:ribosomal protein S27AE
MGQLAIAYLKQVRKGVNFGAKEKVWNQDKCLEALHIWIQEEGRIPGRKDLKPQYGLPTHEPIDALFGGLKPLLRAYEARGYTLPTKDAPKDNAMWPRDRMLDALGTFIADNDRLPRTTEMRQLWRLPNKETVYKYFGSFGQYYAAYLKEGGTPPAEAPTPVWLRAARRPSEPHLAQPLPAQRRTNAQSITRDCLRCGKQWTSPDRHQRWVCNQCHYVMQDQEPHIDGSWLTGDVIAEKSFLHWNDMDISLTPEEEGRIAMDRRAARARARASHMIRGRSAKLMAAKRLRETAANTAEVAYVG